MKPQTRFRLMLPAAALALAAPLLLAQAPDSAAPHAALIEIDGAIGPAVSGYFDKARREATESGARLIVLRIDTPGGLDGAMRDIIKGILASPIPVVSFVAPGGARAASAGTYISYAAHIAAMAPATNLGAATPVPVGGSAPAAPAKPEADGDEAADEDAKAAPAGDAMQKKIVNDAVAYIRSLAERRGRNADWAEEAVREGVSLSANEALAQKVIDLIASDVPDLLQQIDGRSVETVAGEITLKTAGLTVQRYAPDWRFELLSVLTNPTIAYMLMLAGIYGLLLEGYHPGAILPGVVGAICLLLALFAFQLLPINYVGLALLLLGVVLMIAEALVPSFGALGFGGVAAFVFGSIMLVDTDVPGYGVNLGVIAAIAVGAATLIGLTLYLLYRSRQARVTTGSAGAVGAEVEIIEFSDGRGWARLGGERWQVVGQGTYSPGQRARVAEMRGLTLVIKPE